MRTGTWPKDVRLRLGSAAPIIVILLLIVAAMGGTFWYFLGSSGAGEQEGPVLHLVERGDFDHYVLEQGEVESSSNVEIQCEVKSRSAGGQGSTAILWVIPEGTEVKKGELLATLDSSALEDEIQRQKITVNNANAAVITAQAALDQAKYARTEYLEGTFKQEQQLIESEILIAEEKLSRAKDTSTFSERLAALGFETAQQLRADQFAVEQAGVELSLAQNKLKTLLEITQKKMLIGFDSDIEAAGAKLKAEQSAHDEEQKKLKDLTDQLSKCKIYAPEAGQVVYANKQSPRGGTAEFVVEAGASVRERQAIFRLPDPDKMQVRAKINESRVPLVREGMPVTIKIGAFEDQLLQGKVSKVNKYAEPGSWFTSQVKEYATLIAIENPPDNIRTGMTAEVKIYVNQQQDAVLVPVQALHEVKGHLFCLLRKDDRWETKEIEIGASNDEFVTIKSGLEAGDQVAMNPRRYPDLLEIPELPDPPTVKIDPSLKPGAGSSPASAAAGDSAGGLAGSNGPPSGGPGEGGRGPGGRGPGGPGGGRNLNPVEMTQRTLDELDADKDGQLSKDEIAGASDRQRTRLEQADADGDGQVSRGELMKSNQELVKMIQQRMQQGGGGGGGGFPQ